jgi:hypothetical protein
VPAVVEDDEDEGDEAANDDTIAAEEHAEASENETETDEVEGETTDCGDKRLILSKFVILIRYFIRWRKKKGAHQFVSMRQFHRFTMYVRGNSWLDYHW